MKTTRNWCLVATSICGAGLLLCGVGVASTAAHGTRTAMSARLLLGRSQSGRPITALRRGSPTGVRVLAIGCIHGNESAGIAVTRALERASTNADLLIVPDLNPDGFAADTRQDRRGVDLNRNWSTQWQRGGRPWDFSYPGTRPFSEREARIARGLILEFRPRVTIWFHQHMNLVWAWGPSTRAGRLYAHAAGMRFYRRPWLDGTAVNWQNHHLPGSSAFVVELPAGSLSPAQVRAQVSAILKLAASIHGPARA
jgi:protein MpaA